LGAALVQMVAGLALRRAEQSAADKLAPLRARAEGLRQQLAGLAQRDAEAYAEVDRALRLPKGDQAAQEARRRAIQAALKGAAQVPLETGRACLATLELAQELLPHCPRSARSDLACGAVLAWAGLTGALYNVDANCLSIKDPGFLAKLAGERGELERCGGELLAWLRAELEPALSGWLPAPEGASG
jgi:formiminotetrahydrofolate cyclodeaminase